MRYSTYNAIPHNPKSKKHPYETLENGGFAEFIASVCDAEYLPHTGLVRARCGSESDLIHFFDFVLK